jgi:hypothetical protein
VRGQVTAVLQCQQHRQFWDQILPEDLTPGTERQLTDDELSAAWSAMPITAPDE